jgi:hypothetical protein
MCQSKADGGRRCKQQKTIARLLTIPNTGSMIERVKVGGGLTVHPLTGAEPTQGYVLNDVGECPKIDEKDFFDATKGAASIESFLSKNADWFTDGNKHIGFWHDKENKVVVIDRVDVINDLKTATILGKKRQQRAMWDVVNQVQINLA